MSDKAKSWGPLILAGVTAIAQMFIGYTIQSMQSSIISLDSRLGRVESILMGGRP